MTDYDRYTRREYVVGTGLALAGVGLAGCSGDSDGGATSPTDASDDGGDDGGDGTSWTEASTVEMTDSLKYEPKNIQVEAGTTVTWENVGNIGHTVTAYEDSIPDDAAYFASGDFDSESAASEGYNNGQEGNVPGGESWEHTFETTGTYEYYCIPHELSGMVGKVKVV